MRAPSLAIAAYLCAAAVVAAGCSTSSGAGSETHFVCTRDSDCDVGATCIDRRCVASSAGALDGGGGRGAVDGRTNAAGAADVPTGSGGAMSSRFDSGIGDPPLNATACPPSADVAPLDDGCTDAVCHAVIRLDYSTLSPRGWSSIGGPAQAVDANAAKAAAADVFARDCMYCGSEPNVAGANAGLYRVLASPTDFGAFALVGAQSGLVITAGAVIWAGRGGYYVPEAWKPASDLRCRTDQVLPIGSFVDSGECDMGDGKRAPTANDALELALSTNLARGFSQKGPFSAYVYLYTPTVGGCDATVAEYVVVLTR